MEAKEILEKLKEGSNFDLTIEDGKFNGHGAINMFDECKLENNPSKHWYAYVHYPEKKKILESLPWNVIMKKLKML